MYKRFYSFAVLLLLGVTINHTLAKTMATVDDTPFDSLDITNDDIVTLEQLSASLYLNDCISTLTKIQRSKSKIVLTDEQFILNNALRWDGDFTKYRSLYSFRNALQDVLKDMVITETNRQMFKEAFDRKKNAAVRDAILGAVSGTQLNVNVVSLASNIILKSAQSFMEYNKKMDDYDEELEKEMWQLEQEDMNAITEMRKNAFAVLYELFQDRDLNFSEELRLVENDFDNLFNYLELPADIRVDKLVDRESKYKYLPLYWYELGKTYIELWETQSTSDVLLEEAWDAFNHYKSITNHCRLYRFDYNLGDIALYELKYKKQLSTDEKYALLDVVRNNLSNNGNALLFSSIYYIEELSDYRNGINLFCDCLTDKTICEHNEILLYISLIWDRIDDYKLKEKISRSVLNSSDIDIQTYISFLYSINDDVLFDKYSLYEVLQKGIIITPAKNQKKDVTRFVLYNNSALLKNNFDNWNYSLEKIDFHNNKKMISSFHVEFDGKNKKKFFSDLEELANKNSYFKKHRDQRVFLDSHIKLSGKTYYYLSNDKTWDKIQPYMRSLVRKPDKNTKNCDNIFKAEDAYNHFYDKYAVDEIKFIIVKDEDNDQELNYIARDNNAQYSFLVCPILEDDAESVDVVDCKLVFVSDYMKGSDTDFFFEGIIFGQHYVRF